MANMIARLGVLLGLDTAEFNKGLADAERKLEAFAAQAQRGAAIAGAAFVALTTKAMAYADEISDVAKANDIAIDSVIKLQDALANSGGKAEDAGKLLASFSGYVDKAAEGSFEAQKLFAKLGVSFQDLGKLSGEELFGKAVKGIAAIDDSVTRSAKAVEIFGKAAKGVDFQGVAEGMDKVLGETQKQAAAIQQLADLYDKLAQAGREFLLKFIKEFGPMIADTYDYFKNLNSGGSVLFDLFKALTERLIVFGANVAFVFKQIGLEIALTFEQAKALMTLDFEKFGKVYDEYQEKFKRNREEIDRFGEKILGGAGGGRGSIIPPFAVSGQQAGQRREVAVPKEVEAAIKAQSKMQADALRRIFAEQEALQKLEFSYGELLIKINEYEQAQVRRIDVEEKLINLDLRRRDMADYEFEFQRKSIELEYQHQEALRKIDEMQLTRADRAERIKKENELYERQIGLIKKVRDTEELRRTGDITKGFMEAAKDFFQTLPSEMETGAAMFGSVMGNMGRALDNFVRTGKLNFKDFARSVILDLIAIQLKAQAMKLFANLLGFSAGPQTGTTVPVADIPLPGRAEGGPVAGGAAYMVGERGPELFVPRMNGTIIPNKTMGAMGNTTNVTNYNINAIDVKSFEERIMGSSSAVWAANLYAQKRLPLGAGRM